MRGTNAQITSRRPIIAINLQRWAWNQWNVRQYGVHGEHLQRLQTRDARPRRDRSSDEREHGGARRTKARNPAYASGNELWGQDGSGMVHDDRIYRTQEESDKRYADRAREQIWNEPDDELKTARQLAAERD